MTILSSEIEFYESAVMDDTASNGGLMSATKLTSGVSQNVWPNVLKAERDAGSTKYRKVFVKVSNDDDLTLISPMFWLDNPTDGDDWMAMFVGTQTDTQSGISSPRLYGCAVLNADVSSGSGTLTVNVEDSTLASEIFKDGDKVRLTDMDTPTSTTGNEEYLTITGAPTVANGTEVTMSFTTNTTNSYTVAGGGRVMSIYEGADIECATTNWTETSASGTYDEATYPLILDNLGTVQEDWTLEFTDDNGAFTIKKADGTSVGSWDKDDAGPAAPLNSDFSKPYFTLEFAGFSGTWVTGDTITWTTSPASQGIWEKRVVPANCASLSGNSILLAVSGESA